MQTLPIGNVLYICLAPGTVYNIRMETSKAQNTISTQALVWADSSAAVPTHDSHGVSHCSVCSPLHTDCLSLDGSRSHSDLPNVGWTSRKRWKRWCIWPSWPYWPTRCLPSSPTNRTVLQLPSWWLWGDSQEQPTEFRRLVLGSWLQWQLH